MMASYYRSRI